MSKVESLSGFYDHNISAFEIERLEQYRLKSKEGSAFYAYPWRKTKSLFLKIERTPLGFELKGEDYLKQLFKCSSPYVTKYYDLVKLPIGNPVFPEQESVMVITEYNNSYFLTDHLSTLDQDSCIFKVFLIRLLKGFQSLHHLDLLHGDINISNILLHSAYGNFYPRISDLNFFQSINKKTLFISPEYLAPEVQSHDQYNISSELWAIGILMYYLTHNKFPFKTRLDGLSQSDIPQEVSQMNLEFRSDLDPTYVNMLELALQKDLNKRAKKVDDLIKLLLKSLKIKRYFVY